jgi:hypothetical protein
VASTEKCSVKQGADPWLRQHDGQEARCHLARQQPVAVLGEGGGVPDRVVHAEPDEPSEQQVEVDPLDQLAFRANGVEGLQQHRPQQPLRRDRATARLRIKRVELNRHIGQCRVHDGPDRPQRVVGTDPLLKIDVAEQRTPHLVLAAHPVLAPNRSKRITIRRQARRGISAAC